MKSLATLLLGLSLFACHTPSTAQDDQKLRNDPTYSTHNYKHPNKAAAARRWENKRGVAVQPPTQQDVQLSNYKNQLHGHQPTGGIAIPITTDENLANRNYKMQKPSVGSGQDSTLARKRAKKRFHSTIGD